jgi:hypothetical protein
MIPDRRVTLYERCTDVLLYEWDRAKFPKDTAIGNLDANEKRALLRGVASTLHEQHAAEIPESEVVRHFASMLPQLGKAEEDALRIVREIRERSGLLVEHRPGVFAFSHLTFQEYLTALDYARRPEQLLQHLDDPWWDEVIALATGVAGGDTVKIIRGILRKKDLESVILAAKCLETAIDVPLDLRTAVEMALEGILPPRSWDDLEKMWEIGLTVAPILARRLPSYDADGKWWSLEFFASFRYEPIIPILIGLASDSEPTLQIGLNARGGIISPTVGDWATYVLGVMAPISENAERALSLVWSKPRSKQSYRILKYYGILPAKVRASHPDNRSSKRAKSTV